MSSHPPGTPQSSRTAPGAHAQASPHYTTTRRHSLYGTEDRVVIDAGSRVWKVGFSGEGRPREVFSVADPRTGAALWPDLSRKSPAEREDALVILENRLKDILRHVYFELLLADPKSRKVVLVENPLLPLAIKDTIVRVMFLNLNIPSITFAPTHLLVLIAAGRLSGLVLDCGHLESVSVPVFGSRPLYTCMKTSPLAGARLNDHLRSLIVKYARYTPPIGVVSSTIPQATSVPEDVITDAILEDIKTRCLFVGEPVEVTTRPNTPVPSTTQGTSVTGGTGGDEEMSEGELSRSESSASISTDREARQSRPHPRNSMGSQPSQPSQPSSGRRRSGRSSGMYDVYMEQSHATDLVLRIPGPSGNAPNAVISRASLRIPGWVRERAAEILFESRDGDEAGCATLVLDSLLKAPMDLRKELASSIMVAGGTAMLPGFVARLHLGILRLLEPPPGAGPDEESQMDIDEPPRQPATPEHTGFIIDDPSASPTTPRPGATFSSPEPPSGSARRKRRKQLNRVYDPYAPLRPLIPFISVLNHPAPPVSATQSSIVAKSAGKAPGFAPSALAWVGASLVATLKSGGAEIVRDQWEEEYEEAMVPSPPPSTRASPAPGTPGAQASPMRVPSAAAVAQARRLEVDSPGGTAHLLPDWTKPTLRQGAPPVYP